LVVGCSIKTASQKEKREAIVVVGTAALSPPPTPPLLNAPTTATNYHCHLLLTNINRNIGGGQNRFINESAKQKIERKRLER
jgi:hypothetical protein